MPLILEGGAVRLADMKAFTARTAPIALLLPLLAGCATVPAKMPSGTVFSVSRTIPEGIDTSGSWIAADVRVLNFSKISCLKGLDLQWQTQPAAQDRQPMRIAALTSTQADALGAKCPGSFVYEENIDGAGLLLLKAGSAFCYESPSFYLRGSGDRRYEIAVDARSGSATSLQAEVTVSEFAAQDGKVRALGSWKGSALMPVTGRAVLLDLPVPPQETGSFLNRLKLMIVPDPLVWKEGRVIKALPWGRRRMTEIRDRSIGVTWLPPEKAGRGQPSQPNQ